MNGLHFPRYLLLGAIAKVLDGTGFERGDIVRLTK
jgi:hypothetical protein